MRKTKKLRQLAALAALAGPMTCAMATNGMLMEGYGPISTGMGGASQAIDPVSYTHLDVYKRQTVTSPGLRVVLVFGEPQAAQGRDRRTWAGDVQHVVQRLRE